MLFIDIEPIVINNLDWIKLEEAIHAMGLLNQLKDTVGSRLGL